MPAGFVNGNILCKTMVLKRYKTTNKNNGRLGITYISHAFNESSLLKFSLEDSLTSKCLSCQDIGVSENSGIPKWMVKIMENPIKMDDLGGFPIFRNTQKHLQESKFPMDGNRIALLGLKNPIPK